MSWLTVAMLANFTSRGISWEGTPSNRTWPCQGRYSPLMSLDTVDFPQPEAPTRAMELPQGSVKEKSWMRGGASRL